MNELSDVLISTHYWLQLLTVLSIMHFELQYSSVYYTTFVLYII